MKTKVLIITGDHTAPDPEKRGGKYNEEDFTTHNVMVEALASFDDLEVHVMNDHRNFFETLEKNRPDIVVNFCDTGFFNKIALEGSIPAYLEMQNILYTGASPQSIAICYDKGIVRLVGESLGIPVPEEKFYFAQDEFIPNEITYPSLIKPNAADGSLGITKDAVIKNEEEALQYIHWLRDTLPGKDFLVQEYLPGPEYGICLIGNPKTKLEALATIEVDFSRLPKGLNPILSYESKAIPDSPYWSDIIFKKASLDANEEKKMIANCKILFQRLKLRDYARFDFRRSQDGQIKLMEVNPNPAWANDGKMAMMAGLVGIPYPNLLRKIVDTALLRKNS